MLATGFVADRPEEGSLFPSAGGSSADPRVQAVYWRCIAGFFFSARLANPDLRLALFSNVAPPVVDGVHVADVLARLGVEFRDVRLAHRLPASPPQTFGNVLYFLDIMHSLARVRDDLAIALCDCDMVVTKPLDALFAKLDGADFVGYAIDTPPDEDVNGMTRLDMTAAFEEVAGTRPPAPIVHFGGELFATRLGSWRAQQERFESLYRRAGEGQGIAGKIATEEHIFSIAFAELGDRVAAANDQLKRIWTSPRFSNVQSGDENLALWHLPAEKRYGLRDLFRDLERRGFPLDMPPSQFVTLAQRRCGVPRKSPLKILHDGIRQLASKSGMRL